MAKYYIEVENEHGKVVGTSSNSKLLVTFTDGNRTTARIAYGVDGLQVLQ